MSQTDREVELGRPGLAMETARDAGADLAHTARDAGADLAHTARDAGADLAHTARDAGADLAQTARDAAVDVARATRDAAADVAHTAKEEARQVAHTAADEVQEVGRGVRQRLREEVDRQHRQVTDRVGAFAEELYTMARERPDTPAGELVGTLAARSRSFAEYLDQHGPERVLHELQDFARRHPGTFIVSAVAAGFVAGRLGKGLWQNPHEDRRS